MKRITSLLSLRAGIFCLAPIIALLFTLHPASASAHGFIGPRFFPPTPTTEDPFATDELNLVSVSYNKSFGTETTDFGFGFTKEIFPRFAVGIGADYLIVNPHKKTGENSASGFDNIALSAKYQLWENVPHEAIFSIGAEWDVGGTGSRQVGAESANTFTPTIYFGKGFGDLPDSLKFLKPFAITGTIGEGLPTSADPDTLETGFALEYSLPYLQSQVKDIGLPEPLKHMIPLVEFTFSAPENRGGGPTTGTINPGILYEAPDFQIGAEAVIPINSATGNSVGAIVQVQIYLDDIFPRLFGHPLFGGDRSLR